MIHMKVRWLHNKNENPVEIFSELDDERNEVRKVDVFRNGNMQRASKEIETNDTFLSIEPIPSIEFINNQEEFEAIYISEGDFEEQWQSNNSK